MGESGAGTPQPPSSSQSWAGQTLGERIVVAAWRAVAAHLAAADAADPRPPRVATGGAGDLDPVAAVADDAVPRAILDRLR